MPRPRVVIVGGGFGGLAVAQRLKGQPLDLLLIDKTNHHLFQPLLYEVATAALSPAKIAAPIRELLRNQSNASVIMGEVVAVAKQERCVLLRNGERVPYDFLVLATGSRHAYFGQDAWEAYAPGLKTLDDALMIRDQILISFEKAERLGPCPESRQYLNFAIIGGGPTGVEMAGAIAEIAYKTLFKDFRRIRPEESQIYLIEAAPHILPTFPKDLALRAEHDLRQMGVHVITGKKVTEVKENGIRVEERWIEAHNMIWAAGNQASAFLKTLEVPLDRQGRVLVGPSLSIPGHPEIFVIGDAAHCTDKEGALLPGTAPVALQQGKYVAHLLKKQRPLEKRPAFAYFDKGYMATIGRSKAICVIRRFHCGGWLAWLVWCFVHILYLIGFRNRLSVLIEWFWNLLTGKRGVRLIYRAVDPDLPPPRSHP